jgi:hypothetical protein
MRVPSMVKIKFKMTDVCEVCSPTYHGEQPASLLMPVVALCCAAGILAALTIAIGFPIFLILLAHVHTPAALISFFVGVFAVGPLTCTSVYVGLKVCSNSSNKTAARASLLIALGLVSLYILECFWLTFTAVND